MRIFEFNADREKKLKKETATGIHSAADRITEILEESLSTHGSELEDAEKEKYMKAVREILGVILLDIKTPLYRQFPELAPDSLSDLLD